MSLSRGGAGQLRTLAAIVRLPESSNEREPHALPTQANVDNKRALVLRDNVVQRLDRQRLYFTKCADQS